MGNFIFYTLSYATFIIYIKIKTLLSHILNLKPMMKFAFLESRGELSMSWEAHHDWCDYLV